MVASDRSRHVASKGKPPIFLLGSPENRNPAMSCCIAILSLKIKGGP